MKPPSSLLGPQSLRSSADPSEDRGALVAAVKFVEGVGAGWNLRELVEWFAEDLVGPGRMTPVSSVNEAVVGAIALDPATAATASRVATLDDLPKLLAISRSRVVVTLRAFITLPPDDRFLQAAIFKERVQRLKVERGSVWVARPSERDLLSDIVLSLFAADILMHREFHETSMCVCELCGRVSFAATSPSRTSCPDHPLRGEAASGYQRSDTRPGMRRSGSIAAIKDVGGPASSTPNTPVSAGTPRTPVSAGTPRTPVSVTTPNTPPGARPHAPGSVSGTAHAPVTPRSRTKPYGDV